LAIEFIIANEKFTDVLVRALIKSHVPGPRVRKSNGRLKNVMQQRANFTLIALALQIIFL